MKRKASLVEGSTLPKDNAGIDETKSLTKSEKKKLKNKMKLQQKEAENKDGNLKPVKKQNNSVVQQKKKQDSDSDKDDTEGEENEGIEEKETNTSHKASALKLSQSKNNEEDDEEKGTGKSTKTVFSNGNRKKHSKDNKSDPTPPKKKYDEKHTIYIGNLPIDCIQDKLKELFSECGKVKDVRLPTNKPNRIVTKHFAFVQFYDDEGVNNALNKFNNSQLGGQTIRVEKCCEQKRGGGGGRGRISGRGRQDGSDKKGGGRVQ